MIELYNNDCTLILPNIKDKSIKLILADLPYGTSACHWDDVIHLMDYIEIEKKGKLRQYTQQDFFLDMFKQGKSYDFALEYWNLNHKKGLWSEYERIIKDDGAIVLFGVEPFSSYVRSSNEKLYKYDWKWEKPNGANFLNYKYQPAKVHEDIMVFGKMATSFTKKGSMCYNPQFTEGKPYSQLSGEHKEAGKFASVRGDLERTFTENEGKRYPRSIQKFNLDKEKYHPTQKPIELLEYLIKTYSSEGDTVLDNTMGSGSTGVAALNLNRLFIGIEINTEYFKIAETRIKGVL